MDGTDVLAVHEVVSAALERARTEQKMTIIETMTMRMDGHSISDLFSRYVPAEQLAIWKQNDPVETLKKASLASFIVSEDDFARVDAKGAI